MVDELAPLGPREQGPFIFAWRRGLGGIYPVKVSKDMWQTFMKPDGNKANAPHVLKQWELTPEQGRMTLDELSGIFPCPQ